MAVEEKKTFARRDALQQIELDVQKKWEEQKVFEEDAPKEGQEKFLCTFPYPYMNGLLHIGHAFSMTKAVFAAHFQRLLGKKALFPFGFHCTGMPIQAAANKLKREFEVYGAVPTFPAGRPTPTLKDGVPVLDGDSLTLSWKAPPCTGKVDVKVYHLHMSVAGAAFKEVCKVPHPDPATLAKQGKKVVFKTPIQDGSCTYKVLTELVNGKFAPESKVSDEVSIDAAPKDKKGGAPGGKRVAKKILAKSGDAAFQWEILRAMDFEPDDIPAFVDPMHWLEYFPPLGARDLKRFGAPVDFRRSFITTSVNPFYDQFIRWQFRKLKTSDKIGFGKRPTIFSELDGQACMDHDRAEGEGVTPQEYTGIKLKVLEHPPVFAIEG
jgi:leucyl-tRNA synthetase